MGEYLNQKDLLTKIKENINRLEQGEMTLNEMNEHLRLVRDLYERTIMIRYKSLESLANNSDVEITQVVEPTIQPEGTTAQVENEETELETKTSEPTQEESFDFGFEFSEDELKTEVDLSNQTEQIKVEYVEEPISEAQEDVISVSNDAPTHENVSGFYQRLVQAGKNQATQLGFSPLSALNGSFGLNEKLLFINELFDGSSESFSESIKLLDNQENLEQAAACMDEFSVKYNWDEGSEAVADFVTKLSKRFV